MTTKPAESKADFREVAEGEPFRLMTAEEEAEMDAWLFRNKDALNASFQRADEEFARGHYYTLEEVMAHLKADRLKREHKG